MQTRMRNTLPKLAGIGMLTVALAACSNMGQGGYSSASTIPVTSSTTASTTGTTTGTTSTASGYGVVQAINMVPRQQASGLGLGTVAGAVVGGVLGNQVGSGSGRTAATVAGAAGGALVGRQMQRNSQTAEPDTVYQVTVRMDNGALQTLVMNSTSGLQVGERIRVDNGVIVERVR